MRRDPRKYLYDMLDRSRFAAELMQDKGCQHLQEDRVLRSALERELSIVGEALMQLHRVAPHLAERIDSWREIIRFRHVLVHGYEVVDPTKLDQIVRDDLPRLIEQVRTMLST
jgi:uncharacterized protein with HEPN domain